MGQGIYSEQCASCHGDFGEGGVNPARPGDIIAPISTAEYLKTRDDVTLRAVIIQGQPNFGMSPFGIENGGPLDARDVDVLVEYIRSWESNPPVDLPPEVEYSAVALSGSEIYQGICAQCHGLDANGGVGISLRTPDFRSTSTSEDLYQSISLGHKATSMIAWGELLSSTQIVDLVEFILSLPESDEDASGAVSFAVMVMPIFESRCQICHEGDKADGAWSASNYEDVINTGDNSPVIIPGDVENSLLAQKLLGTHEEGDIMPPKRVLTADTIQLILDWIAAGAPDN